jgi:hypothetical protein
MPGQLNAERIAADVKCYYCGHISGQIFGYKGTPLRVSNFVPRPGYTGEPVRPGVRLRCERCGGPVFLEDSTPLGMVKSRLDRTIGETVPVKHTPRAA